MLESLKSFPAVEEFMPSAPIIAATHDHEQLLLLLLSRMRLEKETYDKVVNLVSSQKVDWDRFIRLAIEHGVLILNSRHLNSILSSIPSNVISTMQRVSMGTAMQNLELTKELTRLTSLLTAAGVSNLAYKGPSLAALAYGGIGMRQFTDLDLLVDSENLATSKQIILSQNYHAFSKPEHRAYQKEDRDRSYQGYDLIRNDNLVAIDLQERFGLRFSTFTLSFDELWLRHELMQFGDRKVAVPSLEDYLLILCAHGTQHRWLRLKWVCDISELVQSSPNLNWDVLFNRAHAMNMQRMVHIALLLAHEALDMPLPDEIRARLFADKIAYRMMLQVCKWMFKPAEGFQMLVQRAGFDYGFDLSVRPRLKDKFACILFLTRRRLFPRHSKNENAE